MRPSTARRRSLTSSFSPICAVPHTIQSFRFIALKVPGSLAHKKYPPPRTLQQDFTRGHMVVSGGGAVSYERGTPVVVPSHTGSKSFNWGHPTHNAAVSIVATLHTAPRYHADQKASLLQRHLADAISNRPWILLFPEFRFFLDFRVCRPSYASS
jgi:hypothetical protein